MRDRRNLERFNLVLPATIETVTGVGPEEKVVLHLVTGNICSGGVYFPTKQTLAEGDEVGICLLIAVEKLKKLGGRDAVINVKGKVLRTDSAGMAIGLFGGYEIIPMS